MGKLREKWNVVLKYMTPDHQLTKDQIDHLVTNTIDTDTVHQIYQDG